MISLNSKQLVRPNYPAKLDRSNTLAKGLVGYWPLSEGSGDTAYDLTDSKANGTLVASPGSSPYLFGKALLFNGTSQYIDCGNVLSMGVNNCTFGVWFKTTTAAAEAIIFSRGCTGFASGRYSISIVAGKANFQASGTNVNWVIAKSTTSFNDGKWHQLVGVLDRRTSDATLNCYVDGTLQAQTVTSVGLFNTENLITAYKLLIGAFGNASGTTPPYPGISFPGSIANVSIHYRALSAPEVLSFYQNPWQVYEQPKIAAYLSALSNDLGFFGIF
jgi:hypothetical protein